MQPQLKNNFRIWPACQKVYIATSALYILQKSGNSYRNVWTWQQLSDGKSEKQRGWVRKGISRRNLCLCSASVLHYSCWSAIFQFSLFHRKNIFWKQITLLYHTNTQQICFGLFITDSISNTHNEVIRNVSVIQSKSWRCKGQRSHRK